MECIAFVLLFCETSLTDPFFRLSFRVSCFAVVASVPTKQKHHSINTINFGGYHLRPYNDENTASRLICEVKHRLARIVVRWGTTREVRVL
jgi:hypothetical protein